MRLLGAVTVIAGLISIGSVEAQSLAEHGAAAAGATIGTAAGKPMSGAITKIFGDVDDQAKTAAKPAARPARAATAEKPSPAGSAAAPSAVSGGGAAGGDGGSGSGPSGRSAAPSKTDELVGAVIARRRAASKPRHSVSSLQQSEAALPAPIAPVPVFEPPAPKEPTAEEVAGIKPGTSERDVLAALGVPASRVIIPDDDGHLRESYQFWAKGSPVGTVRLDNGYVVKVEARPY